MTTSVNQFFGDKERDFHLAPKQIVELERVTGAGIGALCKRLFAGDFSLADIRETVRLGLIGGGGSPQEAAALAAAYVDGAPLAQTFPLAVSILEAAWFGVAPKQPAPEGEATNV